MGPLFPQYYLPDWGEIIEDAYERCGLELRSGYDLRTARRSLNLLLLEWANRGYNLWTLDQESFPLQQGAGGESWYTLDQNCIDVVEGVISTYSNGIQQDIVISRMPLSRWNAIPNKGLLGRPVQFFVQRSGLAPSITFWPVADQSGVYTFNYWQLVLNPPVGNAMGGPWVAGGPVDAAIPSRFAPALIAGLAFHLAVKKAPDKAQFLKAEYEEAFALAGGEDRERSGATLVPDVRSY